MNKYILFPCVILVGFIVGCQSSATDAGSGGGTTSIAFDVPQDAYVSFWITNEYNTTVATLLTHERMDAGTNEVDFEASKLPSGIYFYTILEEAIPPATGSFIQTKRMLIIR